MGLPAIPERPFDAPQPRRTASRPHEVPRDLRDAIWTRSGGLCEACGETMRGVWQVHHRIRRGQGGEDSITNCVGLHGLCHRPGIHHHVARSQEAGFLLRTGQDPAVERLALHFERWVLLANDGSYIPVEDAA